MKKVLFTLTMMLVAIISYSQVTYYWVGGTGPTSYTANSNWNTQLDGLGTNRAAAAATDILIFDGTNVGGTTPATGQVTTTATATNCARLVLQNNANVILGRASAGTAVITINGDGTSADDLLVNAGSTLTLGMAVYNYDVQVVMGGSATGLVNGTVYLSPLSNTVHTRSYITVPTANAFVFGTGSAVHITDSLASSGFNASAIGSISFRTGASLYYYTGRSPIGSSSLIQFLNLDPGSNVFFMNSNVSYLDGITAYTSSSWSNLKTFANIFVKNGATFKSDGPFYKIENLTIDNGCTLITHTSGNTPILGNLTVNGVMNGPAASTNTVIMGGNSLQTISGTGTIDVPSLTVANYSDVVLSKSVNVLNVCNIVGKINFGASNQVTGPASFTSRVNGTATSVTGNTVAGSYLITGIVGSLTGVTGLAVTGSSLDVNTNVVGFSSANTLINLSRPALTTATGVAFTFKSDTATLVTANPNGMDTLSGSVVVTDTKSFQSGTNYIINGTTTKPFGISTGSTSLFVNSGFVEINAPVTVNRSLNIFNHLGVSGKLTLRPLDTIHIQPGAFINGAFGTTNYIATDYNAISGAQSIVQYDGLASSVTIPIGTVNYYLPVALNPSTPSSFTTAVFEGITSNGLVNGTQLSAAQKQTVVNAVWNVNRLTGTGTADVQLGWNTALEGSTFTTLPNSDIGLIRNTGSSWALPVGVGNNTLNTVTATLSNFGSLSAGAVPPSQPFIFNAIPAKTYGNSDFNGGAVSLNTTQPIVYTSSNPLVATIVNGDIHIVGAGTSVITASQASDGFYPPASVTQTLTVNPAPLTIKADDKLKFEGQANPTLTATYTGFVLGETAAVLLTPAVLSTTAVLASLPGAYPITVNGATSNNYTITFVNGILTVQAKTNQTITFNALPAKNYGNADFAAGATSTNTTIPITYTSSNTSVATIVGSNIHITGAGTSVITASQAGSVGYFPAADVARTLTVNKVNLTVKVRDTTKIEGQPNPAFTITYTGFVLGETAANLTTVPTVTTTATTTSAPGYYTLTAGGGVSQNYNFIYTAGRLTIFPVTGNSVQYINAFTPSNGILTVRVFSVQPALGDIYLYDMSGRLIATKNILMPAGFINNDLRVPSIPTGIYTIRILGTGVDLKKTIYIQR